MSSFFVVVICLALSCFPLTFGHKIPYPLQVNFVGSLVFGYCQDTKQAVRADRKPLFDANYLFCNTGIWVRKTSSGFFLALSLGVFPAKALAFDVSKYYSKNHNGVFLQNL